MAIGHCALCEWRWGATPGKAACRLRVVGTDRADPRLGQALARAMLYQVVPVLPYGVVVAIRADLLVSASAGACALSFAYYGLLALLLSTARRGNGFAAVHDPTTRTRIISRTALGSRVVPAPVEAPPPAPATIRNLSRVGRLRWLSGRREGGEDWDAFEWVGGQVLPRQAGRPQRWREVRYWLHDLAEELGAAGQDGSLPPVLSLHRVWITDGGRAKLFDLPAPGGTCEPPDLTASDPVAFLNRVAALALGGGAAAGHPAGRAPDGIEMLCAREEIGRTAPRRTRRDTKDEVRSTCPRESGRRQGETADQPRRRNHAT